LSKSASSPYWFRTALNLIAAVALAGCATTASIDPKARTFQRVGVLSVAGTHLTRMNVGITVFGNEREELDVSDWNLDQAFARTVAEALREKTSLDVVVLGPAPESLKSVFRSSSLGHVAVDMDSRWGQAEEPFRALASANNVDALVVLVPRTSGDYFNLTNQILRGFGIYTRSLGERTQTAVLHLISRVVVVSGKTGKVIGHVPVSSVQPTIPGGPHQRGQPSTWMPDLLARTPLIEMTEAQKGKVRELALTLPLKSAMEATVPELLPPK
jgi:hypothetical protein